MATQAVTRTRRTPIAVFLVALIALMGGVFGISAAWGTGDGASPLAQGCDEEPGAAGTIVSGDAVINGTPYSVVPTDQLFPSQLMLDPSLVRDFTVSVSDPSVATVKDVSGMPMHNDQDAPMGINDDAYNHKYYKFGGVTQDGWIAVDKYKTPEQMAADGRDVVDAIMVGFGDENATKGTNPNQAAVDASFEAARNATITVNYGTVGTYSYNDSRGTVPVNMQLVVKNIVPQTSAEFKGGRALSNSSNSNPVFQFAKDPNYGVYFFNVHSADFDLIITNANTGESLGVDDIYLTQSSLSYWQKGGLPKANSVQITEVTKPLSALKKVYFSENSNMSSSTGESFSATFNDEGVQYPKDGEDGFFIPLGGEDNSKNHYTDTVGHEEFPRNAVTFRYADPSHMNFRNATSSNTMWFTMYPQALTNQTPPEPVKTANTEPTKGVYAEGEEIPAGSVRPGSEIEFVVDQEVNKLGISSLVRYHQLVLSDVVPTEVTITDYDVVDEEGNSVTSHGEWIKTGEKNTYTFSFNRDWLQGGMPLNGEHYYLKLKGTVSEEATGTFNNKAETIVNEIAINGCVYNHFFSNVTEMNVVEPKEILYLTNIKDEFTFQVSYRVPEDATEISISDELDPILEAVEASVDGLDGLEAVISDDKKTVTVSAKDNEEEKSTVVTDARGKEVTLTIKAKISEGVTEEDLAPYIDENGTPLIPNTATVKVNDRPEVETNKVDVVPPEDPIKKVNGAMDTTDEEGNRVADVVLANRDEIFEYTVTQKVPSNAVSIAFSDTLVDELEAVIDDEHPATVKAEGSEDVLATPAANGQVVTAEITDADALADLAGKYVTMSFFAKIKDSVSAYELMQKYGANMEVPNTATVSINGNDPVTTNEVLVTPPTPEPNEPEIEKLVETSQAELNNEHGDLAALDEVYSYTIKTTMPQNAKAFKVSDTIDSVLAFDGEATVTVAGKEAGTAVVDDQTLTVTFSEEEVAANAGEEIIIVFGAKIAVSDAELVAKYADRTVPNKASYTITNLQGEELAPKDSNEVTVTPPTPVGSVIVKYITEDGTVLEDWSDVQRNQPEGTAYTTEQREFPGYEFVKMDDSSEAPEGSVVANETLEVIYVYKLPEPELPVKKVNGEDSIKLAERPEVFTYTVSQKLLGDANTASFVDTLEEVLEIVGTPSIDGKGTYEIKVEGNKVTALGTNVIADRGTTVTLTINAKVRDDVTDAQLIAKYGTTTVPNVAEVAINNNPNTTNEVLVTPPDSPREDPEKTINGQKELVTLSSRPDTFTYEVAQVLPAGAKNVVFEDTLEDVLEVVGTPTMNVADADAEITVDGNKVVATMEDASAYVGQKLVLTINAKVRDDVTDADLIAKYNSTVVPNQAIVSINDDPKTTNRVLVTPPVEDQEIVKTVNGKVHEDLAATEEVFTYELAVAVPADAEKVNIFDTLVDELEFVGGAEDVSVTVDGAVIDATTTIDGQALEVEVITYKEAEAVAEAAAEEAAVEEATEEATEETAEEAATDEAAEDTSVLTTGEDEAAAEEAATEEVLEETVAEEAATDEVVEVAEGIDLRTKTIVVTFQAKIKAGANLSAYYDAAGNAYVPNVGSYVVNDDPSRTHESNPVTVTPPAPPVDEPEKFINGHKGVETLADRTDEFTYTVVQTLPANAITATFEDELEDVLEVVSASIDGNAEYSVVVEGNKVVASTTDAAADRGNTVTLTIVAKLRDGVTDEQLIEQYGSTSVPNQATVAINGAPKATNEVFVLPPEPPVIITPPTPLNPPTNEEPPTPEEPEKPGEPTTPVPPTTNNPPTPVTPTPTVTSAPKTADESAPYVAGLAGLAVIALLGGAVAYSRSRKEDVVVPRGEIK